MEKELVARCLEITEVSEWFDWLRRELPLGGVHLPDEETSVWLISGALRLAYRVQGIYGHLPDGLRDRLVKALVVYQCWERQHDLRERLAIPHRMQILPTVGATGYVRPIGTSGFHHVLDANDGFRYVVTVPGGLWTDTISATEVVCNQLARLLGLVVPTPAVVVVDPELLRQCDLGMREFARPRVRNAPRRCCGFRFLEARPMENAASALPEGLRGELLGALLYDLWVVNYRGGRYLLLKDDTTGKLRVGLYDHSRCLCGSAWSLFSGYSHVRLCRHVRVDREDEGPIRKWLKRAKAVDFNSLWELAFEMPVSWYGNKRRSLALLLEDLAARRSSLDREVETLMLGAGASGARAAEPPCPRRGECPSHLACVMPDRIRRALPGKANPIGLEAIHEC